MSTEEVVLTLENGLDVSMTFPDPCALTLATDQAAAFEMAVGTVTQALGDYNALHNLPTIGGTTLKGDLSVDDIGAAKIGNAAILALFD